MQNIVIDTSTFVKLPHDIIENQLDFELFPINEENDKIKFLKIKNNQVFENIQIKPFIHDISSYFGILSIYNETTNEILIYEINKILQLQSQRDEAPQRYLSCNDKTEFIWSHQIQSESIHSIKIIENDNYPLICINSNQGITLLTLKNGTLYQTVNITNNGNFTTKYSKQRPNEVVNLSSNRTLFTYNFINKQYEIIYSNVSCFTITTKGKILFLCEGEIFICDNKSNITNKKRIFSNNISIKNVYQDKAFIISILNESEIIFSLYNYETNEIKSFSYQQIEIDNFLNSYNDSNVTSSIHHTIIVVALREQERFLYFNGESVSKFELIELEDENAISIPIDDNFEFERVNGVYFIDNKIGDVVSFPSLFTFYGKDRIIVYNVISFELEENWPYPIQMQNESQILFKDIKDALNRNGENQIKFQKPPMRFQKSIFNVQQKKTFHEEKSTKPIMKPIQSEKPVNNSSSKQANQSSKRSPFGK